MTESNLRCTIDSLRWSHKTDTLARLAAFFARLAVLASTDKAPMKDAAMACHHAKMGVQHRLKGRIIEALRHERTLEMYLDAHEKALASRVM